MRYGSLLGRWKKQAAPRRTPQTTTPANPFLLELQSRLASATQHHLLIQNRTSLLAHQTHAPESKTHALSKRRSMVATTVSWSIGSERAVRMAAAIVLTARHWRSRSSRCPGGTALPLCMCVSNKMTRWCASCPIWCRVVPRLKTTTCKSSAATAHPYEATGGGLCQPDSPASVALRILPWSDVCQMWTAYADPLAAACMSCFAPHLMHTEAVCVC